MSIQRVATYLQLVLRRETVVIVPPDIILSLITFSGLVQLDHWVCLYSFMNEVLLKLKLRAWPEFHISLLIIN